MSTLQHAIAVVVLSGVYYITEGRLSVVLFLGFAYFFYVKEFSKTATPSRDQEKSTGKGEHEHEHKHKHKNGKGGCGSACTCKNKKEAPKKTLSSLKLKKGFGQKNANVEDKSVAIDFTTTFSKSA